MRTSTYTSTLPVELIQMLNNYAKKLKMPKNKLIENALRRYIENIKKAEYIHSFKKVGDDPETLNMAEEGMEDYFRLLDKE